MIVLAAIPARLGATRLPRKPLRLLGGVPLIVRVAQRLMQMRVADRYVVATDSPDIEQVCHTYHIPVALTRRDHPSGTDRVAEVANLARYADCEVVVNVQGDEPFVSREAVLGAIAMVQNGGFTLGTAASAASSEVLGRPDVVKVVCADNGRAMYFSRAPIPYLRDPGDAHVRDTLVHQHIGVYAYTRAALQAWVSLAPHPLEVVERLEQLRPLAHGVDMGVALVAPSGGFGIDTEDDLARAEVLWSQQSSSKAFLASDAPHASANFLSSNTY